MAFHHWLYSANPEPIKRLQIQHNCDWTRICFVSVSNSLDLTAFIDQHAGTG